MPTGQVPIPVLSTVNFKNFLGASSTKSSLADNDQILFLDKNSGQLNRITKSNMAMSAQGAYKGIVGTGSEAITNYNNALESGYYTINTVNNVSNQPNWNSAFASPGVLQVRTTFTSSSTVTVQIATARSTSSPAVEGYFIRRIPWGGTATSWTFVPEDFSKNAIATPSSPGLMAASQASKLNTLTSYSAVNLNQNSNGLMTTSMLSQLNTAYDHATSRNTQLTSKDLNFYRIAVNDQGHVTNTELCENASSTSSGLMDSNSYIKLAALTTKTATSLENGYMSNKQYQKLSSIQSARLRFIKSSSKQWVDLKAPRSWFLIHGYHVSDNGGNESLSACHIDRTGLRYIVPIFSSLPSGMVIKTSSSTYSYTQGGGTAQTGYYVRIERNANDSADYYLHFIGFENMPIIGRRTDQVAAEPDYIDEST